MSARTDRLMADILDVGEGKLGNDSERKTRSVSIIERMTDVFLDRAVALVDLKEFMVLPRDGWYRMTTKYSDSQCIVCQSDQPKGATIWLLQSDSTKVMCEGCGSASAKRLKVVAERDLFGPVDDREA